MRLAQAAQAEDIDYAVVITPYYVHPTEDELVEHYVEICRAVHIPVMAYNIPERTGVELTPVLVERIAAASGEFRRAEGFHRPPGRDAGTGRDWRGAGPSPSSSGAIT